MIIWILELVIYLYYLVLCIKNIAAIHFWAFWVVATRAIQALVRSATNFGIYRTATNGNVTARAIIATADSSTISRTSSHGTATNGNIFARAITATADSSPISRTSIYGTATNGNIFARAITATADSSTPSRTSIYGTATNGNIIARVIIATADSSPRPIRGNS